MTIPLLLILTIVGLAVLYVLLPVAAITLHRFREKRVVTCPETGKAASIEVDATHAAATSLLGPAELRIASCSRLREHERCGEECLDQVEPGASRRPMEAR